MSPRSPFRQAAVLAVLLLHLVRARPAAAFVHVNASLPGAPKLSAQCPTVRACLESLASGGECAPLPVPARSMLSPPPPETPVVVTRLRAGVWALLDLTYISLVLLRGHRLAVIDFPDSEAGFNVAGGSGTRLTDIVLRLLAGVVPRRIDMVYSHGHYDHIGAGTRFFNWAEGQFPKARVFIWGTLETKHMIAASTSKRAPLPTVLVHPRGRTLQLSDDLVVRMRPIGGHMSDDLALYIPRRARQPSILMHVDVVFPRWAPFSNIAFTTNVTAYVAAFDALLRYDFDVFVAGHLRLGDRADVEESGRFAKDLLLAADMGRKMATPEMFAAAGLGRFSDPAAPEFLDLWFAAVPAQRNVRANICSKLLIEKWGCRLGGLYHVVESHCFVAITYLNLEMSD